MGLIELARRSLAFTASLIELGHEILDQPKLPPHGLDDENPARWSGPDDMWPDNLTSWPEEPVIADTASEPELVVTMQWGLALPSGEIAWNSWSGVQFGDPLNRVLMVAKLKRTGLDLGFAEDQLGEFLCRYGWVTRNQLATVVYEDTGSYALIDPEVSAQVAPEQGLQNYDNESKNGSQPALGSGDDPDPEIHGGSVGGDAQ